MLHSATTNVSPIQSKRDTDHDRTSNGHAGARRARVTQVDSSLQHASEEELGPKDVLVVEDEPYLCDLIADVLEAEGHTTRKASNGLDALELLSDRPPQLVLLDLMMPVMDGWEFMTELRANPAWRDIPVVIITAVYDVAKTETITGAAAVITKPFDIDQLSEVVRRYAN